MGKFEHSRLSYKFQWTEGCNIMRILCMVLKYSPTVMIPSIYGDEDNAKDMVEPSKTLTDQNISPIYIIKI